MSAKARKRHEKGMDRAEAVMDKKSVRIEKSRGRARTVQDRAKNWEELNKKLGDKKSEKENLDSVAQDDQVDEDSTTIEADLNPESVSLPEAQEDEGEIL
jgi:hypothetical protein